MGRSGGKTSGGGAANAVVVRKFPWTSSTPGLWTPSTGWSLYTPTVGDLLLDVIIEVDTAITGPAVMDVGTITSGTVGLFDLHSDAQFNGVDITGANRGAIADTSGHAGLKWYSPRTVNPTSLVASVAQSAAHEALIGGTVWYDGGPPYLIGTANPIKAWVTTTGAFNGPSATPGASAGTIYLVTATPS